ncbi:MAG: hypothetical protein H2069_08240 [Legionella sp.]|nr:hypothetical protein [Legionella sp.]
MKSNKESNPPKNGLRAIVYYWPNCNINFGHVAVEIQPIRNYQLIKDPFDRFAVTETFYVSWAMGNNYSSDVHLLEALPKLLILPVSPMNFELFKANFIKSSYYYDKEEPCGTGKPYGSGYNFFKNNCADAVEKTLRMAGYCIDFPRLIALRPATVIKGAYSFALQEASKQLSLLGQNCTQAGSMTYERLEALSYLMNLYFQAEYSRLFVHSKKIGPGLLKVLTEIGQLEQILKTKDFFTEEKLKLIKSMFSNLLQEVSLDKDSLALLNTVNQQLIIPLQMPAEAQGKPRYSCYALTLPACVEPEEIPKVSQSKCSLWDHQEKKQTNIEKPTALFDCVCK